MAICKVCGIENDGAYGAGYFCSRDCRNRHNSRKNPQGKRRLNLINHRFCHLTVVESSNTVKDKNTGKPRTAWLCRCDCGRDKVVVTEKLRAGEVTNCCHQECKYHRPLHYDDNTESSFNSLFLNYKTNARKKKHQFGLSREEFRGLTLGDCRYCGALPLAEWRVTRVSGTKTDPYLFNGIDRIDSSQGYSIGNCVSCCKRCNRMKMELSVDEFIAHIGQVLNHWKGGMENAGHTGT